MEATLNPKKDMTEEKTLFIEAWQPLLNHPALTLPSHQERANFIRQQATTLETEVEESRLNRICVEEQGKLFLATLLSKSDELTNSLKLRILLMSDDLEPSTALKVWEEALTLIQTLSKTAKQLEILITTGPCEHAKWLTQFGFINTKAHPEPSNTLEHFNPQELERWVYTF